MFSEHERVCYATYVPAHDFGEFMKNVTVIFVYFLFFLSAGESYAEKNEWKMVRGRVLDIETGSPVPMASVRAGDNGAGALAGEDGTFRLRLPYGENNLILSRAGYARLEKNITVSDTTDTRLIFFLEPYVYRMEEVTVKGGGDSSALKEIHEETTVLSGEELQQNVGVSLAETMKNQSGVAMQSMGPAPSRPVVRGMSGDRVVIGREGLGTADLSATSPDHAVTVEPFTVDRIEIIRGPETLLYSPVTIGGIINTRTESIPRRLPGSITGTLGTYGETARQGGLGAATVTLPVGTYALHGEATSKRTGEERTPSGTLDNTSLLNRTYVLGASRIFEHGHAGISIDEYKSEYGIPGGFIGGHPNGVDIDMLRRSLRFSSSWAPQDNRMRNLTFDIERTYYTHIEYESAGHVGAEFLQKHYTAKSTMTLDTFSGEGTTRLSAGYRYRDLEMGGYVFTAPTRMNAFSAAVYHEQDIHIMELHIGGRYDHTGYDPRVPSNEQDTGNARDRSFNTVAASAAVVYPFSSRFTGGVTLSRSARVPTVEELYNEGPHLAAYSYETGNPTLGTEYGTGLEVFAHWDGDKVSAVLTGYVNEMNSYIVFRNTGEINWQQILPIYSADAVDARLVGFETNLKLTISPSFTLDMQAHYTHGSNLADNLPLPMIPPLKTVIDTRWEQSSLLIGVEMEGAAAQDRIDMFEEKTPGYTIVRPYIQKTFFQADIIHRLTLSVDNVFNTEYRNHLSRIKSIMPEAGRNVRLNYKLLF